MKEFACWGVVGVGGSDPVGVTALGAVAGAPFFGRGYFRISAQRTNWEINKNTFFTCESRAPLPLGLGLLDWVGVGG